MISISCISRCARHRRRRNGRHGDDLCLARCAHHSGLSSECGMTSKCMPGNVSWILCTRTSDAKIAFQLGHAGRKGSTRLGWEGIDQPLESGNWPLVSASPIPYIEELSQTPQEATPDDMVRIKADFVIGHRRAVTAGFDWLEFHCAHGYLLSSFISPLTNQRTDEYGGSLENRCRYPLEVFRAMRAVWPKDKPMSVRISAHDWVPGGLTPEDAGESRTPLQGCRR